MMRDKMECPACMKWTWADALACEWCGGSLPPPSVLQHQYAAIPAAMVTSSNTTGLDPAEVVHLPRVVRRQEQEGGFWKITGLSINTSPGISPEDFFLSVERDMSRAARRTVEKAILGPLRG